MHVMLMLLIQVANNLKQSVLLQPLRKVFKPTNTSTEHFELDV